MCGNVRAVASTIAVVILIGLQVFYIYIKWLWRKNFAFYAIVVALDWLRNQYAMHHYHSLVITMSTVLIALFTSLY